MKGREDSRMFLGWLWLQGGLRGPGRETWGVTTVKQNGCLRRGQRKMEGDYTIYMPQKWGHGCNVRVSVCERDRAERQKRERQKKKSGTERRKREI